MDEPIFIAEELATQLGEHRSSNLENQLSKVFRGLSEESQLTIIIKLLKSNVRAAAAIAARGGISSGQQIVLLELVLKSGQTNALKVMVRDVFAKRMRTRVFVRALERHRCQFPQSVSLAAYYFLTAGEMNSKFRSLLRSLSEETR